MDIERQPGPRGPNPEPRPPLPLERDRVKLEKTRENRRKLLHEFSLWLFINFQLTLGILIGDLPKLNDILDAWGVQLYHSPTRRPVGHLSELLNCIAASWPLVRRMLPKPWSLVNIWQELEPTIPHLGMPLIILRALICLYLLWGWPTVGLMAWLMFGASLRPIEGYVCEWDDITTPSDRMEGGDVTFVTIQLPKVRWLSA
jgi:hypothetical protein